MANIVLQKLKTIDKAFNKLLPLRYFRFTDTVDQCLRWIPMIVLATAEVWNIETKHNFNKSLQMGLAAAVINTTHWPVKHLVRRRRPGFLKNRRSFPSGHTTMAFAGAALFRKEVQDTKPALAIAMYGVAVAAAIVRMGRKKHWLTDVLAGAAWGMLSAGIGRRLVL